MRYAIILSLLLAAAAHGQTTVPLADTFEFDFNTVQPSTGAPYALGGTPAIEVYEEGGTSQITGGITLTSPLDSVTGLHHVAIVCSAANGYDVGKWYSAVIAGTTPTVDSVSVAGRVVARFRVVPEETVAGYQKVDSQYIGGTVYSSALLTLQNIIDGIDTWWKELDFWVQVDSSDRRVRHHATDPTPASEPTRYTDALQNDGEEATP